MLLIIKNIILGISLAAPIGPTSTEMIKRGLHHGFWPSFLVHLGATVADILYLLLIYFGLSPLVTNPIMEKILLVLGAGVLLYLGYDGVKEYYHKIDLTKSSKSMKNSFMSGFLINVTNPYAIIWWLGIFGAILTESLQEVTRTQALFNSFTIIIGVLLWGTFLSTIVHFGKRWINQRTAQYVSGIGGLVLMSFGLYFGYSAVIAIF